MSSTTPRASEHLLRKLSLERNRGDWIIASNFLFYSSYTIIFLHPFFYFHNADLVGAIVLGMAIFGALQVGGFFFLEAGGFSALTSLEAMLVMRVAATILLVIPEPAAVVSGFALLGLSHSLGFVAVRRLLGRQTQVRNAFFKLSMSTNIAYFVMPHAGALMIGYSSAWIAFLLSLFLSLCSYGMLRQAEAEGRQEAGEAAPDQMHPAATVFRDGALFALFVLPYTVMMTLVSIKTYLAGHGAEHSSMLFSANSLIIIGVLTACLLAGRAAGGMAGYLVVSAAAVAFCAGSMQAEYLTFVVLFMMWSCCEAYQAPVIEQHIFARRRYLKSQLKWIVGVDGLCSFIGPILAGQSVA